MNRNVVGMAFNSKAAGANRQYGCDTIERGQRGRTQVSGSAVEETEFAQADHEPFYFPMKRYSVNLNFVLQCLLQLGLESRKICFFRRSGKGVERRRRYPAELRIMFDILDRLYGIKGHRLGQVQRNLCVRIGEHTEVLKRHLNRQCEPSDFPLVDLR